MLTWLFLTRITNSAKRNGDKITEEETKSEKQKYSRHSPQNATDHQQIVAVVVVVVVVVCRKQN